MIAAWQNCMYLVNQGGSRVGMSGELANTQYKKNVYAANGLGQGDGYYGLSQIPWGQLRILKKWDGAA